MDSSEIQRIKDRLEALNKEAVRRENFDESFIYLIEILRLINIINYLRLFEFLTSDLIFC